MVLMIIPEVMKKKRNASIIMMQVSIISIKMLAASLSSIMLSSHWKDPEAQEQ